METQQPFIQRSALTRSMRAEAADLLKSCAVFAYGYPELRRMETAGGTMSLLDSLRLVRQLMLKYVSPCGRSRNARSVHVLRGR